MILNGDDDGVGVCLVSRCDGQGEGQGGLSGRGGKGGPGGVITGQGDGGTGGNAGHCPGVGVVRRAATGRAIKGDIGPYVNGLRVARLDSQRVTCRGSYGNGDDIGGLIARLIGYGQFKNDVPVVLGAVKVGLAVSPPVRLAAGPLSWLHCQVAMVPSPSLEPEPSRVTVCPPDTVWSAPALAVGLFMVRHGNDDGVGVRHCCPRLLP